MSIIIDGVRLIDVGIRAKLDSEILGLPATRDKVVTIPEVHGAIHMGSKLNPKPFNLNCRIVNANSTTALHYAVNDLNRIFLDDYGNPKEVKLVRESEWNKYYMAKYSGAMPIEQLANYGDFSLPLTAYDPMKKSIVENHEIHVDSEIVTVDDDHSIDTVFIESQQITAPQTLETYVNGYALRPTILIDGTGNNVNFQVNGKSFSLKDFSNSSIEIKGKSYTVFKNGVNQFSFLDGKFIDLLPGLNKIQITGNNMNFNLSIRIRDQYM